jgi:hypothetical protein
VKTEKYLMEKNGTQGLQINQIYVIRVILRQLHFNQTSNVFLMRFGVFDSFVQIFFISKIIKAVKIF